MSPDRISPTAISRSPSCVTATCSSCRTGRPPRISIAGTPRFPPVALSRITWAAYRSRKARHPHDAERDGATRCRRALQRFPAQQFRRLAGEPGGLADEKPLEGRHAVDQSQSEVARNAQQVGLVGEQTVETVGRESHGHGVETAPTLVTLQNGV